MRIEIPIPLQDFLELFENLWQNNLHNCQILLREKAQLLLEDQKKQIETLQSRLEDLKSAQEKEFASLNKKVETVGAENNKKKG